MMLTIFPDKNFAPYPPTKLPTNTEIPMISTSCLWITPSPRWAITPDNVENST